MSWLLGGAPGCTLRAMDRRVTPAPIDIRTGKPLGTRG